MCINRGGLVAVAHLSDEFPADIITEHKTIMRICYYLPFNDIFPTGNKQKVVYLFIQLFHDNHSGRGVVWGRNRGTHILIWPRSSFHSNLTNFSSKCESPIRARYAERRSDAAADTDGTDPEGTPLLLILHHTGAPAAVLQYC